MIRITFDVALCVRVSARANATKMKVIEASEKRDRHVESSKGSNDGTEHIRTCAHIKCFKVENMAAPNSFPFSGIFCRCCRTDGER